MQARFETVSSYTVKNSSKTGDDGWKEMLAPAG